MKQVRRAMLRDRLPPNACASLPVTALRYWPFIRRSIDVRSRFHPRLFPAQPMLHRCGCADVPPTPTWSGARRLRERVVPNVPLMKRTPSLLWVSPNHRSVIAESTFIHRFARFAVGAPRVLPPLRRGAPANRAAQHSIEAEGSRPRGNSLLPLNGRKPAVFPLPR
jgi:hypothetical protein